jgi:hypothetical protein
MKFPSPLFFTSTNTQTETTTFTSLWIFRITSIVSIGTILTSIIIITWVWQKFPPYIPLWYSKPWGQDRLASPISLFLLPISTLLIYLTNVITAFYMRHKHPIYARILLLTSLLVSVISVFVVIGITKLVT